MNLSDFFNDQQTNGALTTKLIEEDTLLLEGNSASFRSLGNLLLAMAEKDTAKVQLGPKVAGNIFFSEDANIDLYVNKVSEGSGD